MASLQSPNKSHLLKKALIKKRNIQIKRVVHAKKTVGRKLASLQSPKKSRLLQEDGGGEFGPPAKL